MIWVDGAILPDDGLAINAADRTFEHGLGLFETLRTWGGRPTLLIEHKTRMLRSAEALRIPIDPSSLPELEDVARLLEAEGAEVDRLLRITATGGTASGKSVVWMRSGPLPTPTRDAGAIVCVNAWSRHSSSPLLLGEGPGVRGVASPPTRDEGSRGNHSTGNDPHPGPLPEGEGERGSAPDDFTARHKTLNYWFKRVAHEHARDLGYDETLILADPWGYVEASRSNLFLVIGDELITTSTEAPIVPGIMRRLILDVAGEWPLEVREVRNLPIDRLRSATEIFLTNAVRGIIPVARVDTPGGPIDRPSPGPWTAKLQESIARRLWTNPGTNP